MRTAIVALVGLSALSLVAADCPNACSGHGDCQSNWDYCSCYHGWLGADCSQRLCQFGLSWIDTPTGDLNHDNVLSGGNNNAAGVTASSALNPMWRFNGWWERHPAALYGTNDQSGGALPFHVRAQEGHFYAECSNRGLCNRETGLCDCLTGYEGAACNRTVCQNDCSGHGTCQTIREVTPDHLHYRLWDMDKTRICVCDGGYFGMDCSNRNCMQANDPLTITSTTQYYDDGLTEADEVQIVEVRCPFNGKMLDPSVTMTYTDVQFGDEYQTPRFNPTDVSPANAATVMGLLKGLPNQVLADYAIDGQTVYNKVKSVSGAQLEADNFYAWTVTFDKSMGDVPMLGGTAYFKCDGGAEVSTLADDGTYLYENVDVHIISDGPQEYIELDGDFSTTTDWDYTAYDSTGATIGTGTFVVADCSGGASATDDYTAFATPPTRELEKVTLCFPDGAAGGPDRTASHLNIKIHVDPTVTARNDMYELVAGTTHTITALDTTGEMSVEAAASVPGYDQNHHIEWLGHASENRALWSINGETIGFVVLSEFGAGVTAPIMASTSNSFDVGAVTTSWSDFHTWPALGRAFIDDLIIDETSVDGGVLANIAFGTPEVFEFALEKDPSTYMQMAIPLGTDGMNPIDAITVSYANAIAPAMDMVLVLNVVDVASGTDKYRWKVAGDTHWVVPEDGSGDPGFPMTSGGVGLGELEWYLTTRYPDDPMRAGLASVVIDFTDGVDNDERICDSTSTKQSTYYIQFGSSGVNDAPVCADRGVCDYGSGICRCFKGYAGIDCTEQNALAAGFSGSSGAF